MATGRPEKCPARSRPDALEPPHAADGVREGVGEGVTIVAEPPSAIPELDAIPSVFDVRSVFEVELDPEGPGGVRLRERPLAEPYVKDYDADAGEGPSGWPERFDVSGWGVLSARVGARRVGSAVVAWRTPGLDMAEGRADLAVLWDLRVDPAHRRRGLASALFRATERWVADRGGRWLKVETQNVNVPACRLYARMGCELGRVHRHAYPTLPDEVQLFWYKRLG